LTQTRIVGGSAVSGTVEVTVKPVRVSPSPTVKTLTPPNSLRMAALKLPGSCVVAGAWGQANVIP